jgi:hypothetical protein
VIDALPLPELHRAEVADLRALAAKTAPFGLVPHLVSGGGVLGDVLRSLYPPGKRRGPHAHAAARAAVADDTDAPAGGHLEEGLVDMPLAAVLIDDGQGFLPGYAADVIL